MMHYAHPNSIVTHLGQTSKEEVIEEYIDFMNLIWTQWQRLDIDIICDQYGSDSHILFHACKMLEAIGMHTVHIKSSKDKYKKCTVALQLQPMGIFKGVWISQIA